jgi:hypothetical protein
MISLNEIKNIVNYQEKYKRILNLYFQINNLNCNIIDDIMYGYNINQYTSEISNHKITIYCEITTGKNNSILEYKFIDISYLELKKFTIMLRNLKLKKIIEYV